MNYAYDFVFNPVFFVKTKKKTGAPLTVGCCPSQLDGAYYAPKPLSSRNYQLHISMPYHTLPCTHNTYIYIYTWLPAL